MDYAGRSGKDRGGHGQILIQESIFIQYGSNR
jgi:hypothetical protein